MNPLKLSGVSTSLRRSISGEYSEKGDSYDSNSLLTTFIHVLIFIFTHTYF